jgi:lipopolysaccharide/colanic/teichoic acid biosynthesis glycosyltransferase
MTQSVMTEMPGKTVRATATASSIQTMREAASSSHAPVEVLRPWYIPLKMAIDWVVTLAIFIAVAPLIGLMWLAVKLTSPGPGLYKQMRLGRFGKPYAMYKIRTMTHNCEAKTGAVWSGPNDSRVTKVGRFLRDTHLDELPQLINILRCEMSLVGPRPERPELVTRIRRRLPRYTERMLVKPGLTGFAQIQHPADLDMDHVRRKLMYDLYYVREIGPVLDLRILFGTFFYFGGMTLKALGKLSVRAPGSAAEQIHDDLELLDDEDTQLQATGL